MQHGFEGVLELLFLQSNALLLTVGGLTFALGGLTFALGAASFAFFFLLFEVLQKFLVRKTDESIRESLTSLLLFSTHKLFN